MAISLTQGLAQAETLFKAQVDKNQIKLGENITLKVLLLQENTQGALGVSQPVQPVLPEMPDWVLRDQSYSQNISVVQNNMRMLLHFNYVLSPKKAGKLQIPSLSYDLQENGQTRHLETNPIDLEVIDPAIALRWKSGVFAGLFFILLGLGYGVLRWLPRRLKRTSKHVNVPLQANTLAAQLQHLQQQCEQDAPPAERIVALQTVVYQFIEERYGLSCAPLTHQEILQQLEFHPKMHPAHWNILAALLTLLNHFCYQPIPPTATEWQQVLQQLHKLMQPSKGSGALGG